jgi:hypothetical protein
MSGNISEDCAGEIGIHRADSVGSGVFEEA